MRRNLVALALAAVTALGLLGLQPAPVAAAEGYVETGASTYRLDPTKGVVRVTVWLKFTNRTRDSRDPYPCTELWFGFVPTPSTCYRTTRYYFSSTKVWVENEATSIKAASSGSTLKVKPGPKGDGYRPVTVTFPNLFYGDTRKIRVTYVIKGGAPRTSSPVRAGRAYASFCAIGNGTDSATLTVRVPRGFDLRTTGGKLSVRTSGKERIYASGRIEDPSVYWACFDGANETGYRSQELTAAGGRGVTIRSWPEDAEWANAVREELSTGLPSLVKLIGRPTAGTAPIVIREAVTGGEYAGFYDHETGTITVDEDFDQPALVQHELAHMWFNASTFTDAWLSEGHAEWAGRAASGDVDACARPADTADGITLAEWRRVSPRSTEAERAALRAQYEAACYVVTQVAGAAGPDRMSAALTALLERRDPYATDPAAERVAVVATWRDWLDVVDELALTPAGAPGSLASDLLVEFGVTGDRTTLARRTEARTAYHELVATVGDWVVPVAVRDPLAAWDFERAASAVLAADQAWTITGRADAALVGIDARHGPAADAWAGAASVEALYQAAALAQVQLAAAEEVAEAAALAGQPLDFVQQVGLIGAESPDLDPAVAAVRAADRAEAARLAASIRDTIGGLRDAGRTRIGVTIAVVVTVLALVILLVSWRVQSRRVSSRRPGAERAAARPPAATVGVSRGTATVGVSRGARPEQDEAAWPPAAIGAAGPSVDDSPTQVWAIPRVPPPVDLPGVPPAGRPVATPTGQVEPPPEAPGGI